ncbi:GNAT family N-acetyltransferase [Gudongella sp. DL1XJH-153]|uniref:GNAT family N-acetyltransferase n=1 Tax=Gudongella sp. DL1XJH-153 TaxID=3409804 RepID=UPI003BB6BAB8
MSKIKLIKPAVEYAEDIMTYKEEFLQLGDSLAGCGSLRDHDTAAGWLHEIDLLENEETCPEGKVCSNTYLAVKINDNSIVGIIDFRHHIDHPILGLWGGHIGYSVRPAERGKGYAKEMLKQVLQKCKEHGLSRVMVTCDANNIASKKIILSNGGVFDKDVQVEGEIINRYWIEL